MGNDNILIYRLPNALLHFGSLFILVYMKLSIGSLCISSMILMGCSNVSIPEKTKSSDVCPTITPDYTTLSIPYNIAPLNFLIEEAGDEFIARAHSTKQGLELKAKGKEIRWNIKDWHELLESCKGDTLFIDIYVKNDGLWTKFEPIKNHVAEEPIDEYISYRLIEPSFVMYENISINQRNLTNFDEKVIFCNGRPVEDFRGRCINCHSYQDYNRTERMQIHIREYKGGTMITQDGKVKKVNMKAGTLISGGVYPAWHPELNLIAYSANSIRQHFHSKDNQKVEVMDLESELMLYDVDRNEVSEICNGADEMETFPSWSPDGNSLYYVSARYPEDINRDKETLFEHYKDIKYDIFRRSFDRKTYKFSEADTVFMASEIGKSATFPRISPDGHYLLFTMADYGSFHIWHKSSDLYLMDLQTGELRPMTAANSDDVDSYHSWSSNGAWIIFSSRRDDGSFTRPYICYFKDGKESKPFILPQKKTAYYETLMKSYNIPEFMVKPVNVSRREWVNAAAADAQQAVFME